MDRKYLVDKFCKLGGKVCGQEAGSQNDKITDLVMMLLKPATFKVRNKGDPEQLLQDFIDYVNMDKFFTTTAALGAYTDDQANCEMLIHDRLSQNPMLQNTFNPLDWKI